MAAGGEVSTTLAEWLIVFLILFSLVTELALHRLEHWVAHRHVHLQAVLRNLYRELMILGIISFGFVMYEISEQPDKDTVVSFEVAHFFIFLFAVLHTFVVMCTIFMSLRLSATWKKLERMELIQYLELKDSYRKLREQVRKHKNWWWRHIGWWFPNPVRAWRYLNLHDAMAFHDIRFQFIYYRNLPPDFKFSTFLRKIKAATFIELVEVHWSLYIFFLAVVLGDIVRRTVFDFPVEFDPSFMIAEAIANAIFVSVLAYKIRKVYWKLTKHPATYYDKVDKNILEEELTVAQLKVRQERRRSRHSSLDGVLNNLDESGTNGDDETDRDPSVSMDRERPRPRTSLGGGLEFRGRNGSRGTSIDSRASTPGFEKPKPDGRITNLAYKPPESPSVASVSSSHHDGEVTVDIEEIAARHSLQRERKNESPADSRGGPSSLDSRRAPSSARDVWDAMYSSDHNSGTPVPPTPNSAVPHSAPLSAADMAVAAARRRSLERLSSYASDALPDANNQGRPSVSGQRYSVDGPASRNSRTSLDRMSGRNSVDGPTSRNSLEGRMSKRGSVDNLFNLGKPRPSKERRQSVELVETIPRDELAERHSNSRSYGPPSGSMLRPTETFSMDEADFANMRPKTTSKAKARPKVKAQKIEADDKVDNAMVPKNSRGNKYWNPSIIKNAEERDNAEHETTSNYPTWLVRLFPRLGRAASPAEKLFWFGSHRFFIWCVEWTFFFATIDVAVTSATFAMIIVQDKNRKKEEAKEAKKAKEAKEKGKEEVPTVARAEESSDGKSKEEPEEMAALSLFLAALIISIVSLFYVLIRIAGIMKKYIFVLNNASLLPESVTIQAIHNIRLKRHLQSEMYGIDLDGSGGSGSDTEMEDAEAAKARRSKYWGFFQGHAKNGELPSDDDDDDMSMSDRRRSMNSQRERMYATRRRAEARRLERARNTVVEPYLPEIPTESTIDVGGMSSDYE